MASTQSSKFVTLPAEVLEDVLVFIALAGAPRSISSLAQTCRHFRSLIYDPLDGFLWRRVFLSTFDDPRVCGNGKSDAYVPFDWGGEFRTRIWTASYVRSRLGAGTSQGAPYRLRSRKQRSTPTQAERDVFSEVLHTLDRVLDTPAAVPALDASKRTQGAPGVVDAAHPSLNIIWLRSVLSSGLPREFNPRYRESDTDPYWNTSEDAQLVHKIVALLGPNFDKTPYVEVPLSRTGLRWPRRRATGPESIATDDSDMPEQDLLVRARFLSQRKIYGMHYPSRRRAWGPFQMYYEQREVKAGDEGVADVDEDEDSDDEDYVPYDAGTDDDFSSEGEEEDVHHPPAQVYQKPPPEPEHLRVDWLHVAAMRTDIQLALEDTSPEWPQLQDALTSWDNIRAGAWISEKPDEVTDWDWAGAEGVWRRCVVWLDYSELHYYNTRGFPSSRFDETCLTVPLTMRIVGYSPCTVPGYEHRPNIHIEGEMGGSGWVPDADARRIHGTVGMVGDGSIRWSIALQFSSVHGLPNEDEWCTEGVQVGGAGSTAGILGLWTGAEHEPGDPIGAWWQWRVA